MSLLWLRNTETLFLPPFLVVPRVMTPVTAFPVPKVRLDLLVMLDQWVLTELVDPVDLLAGLDPLVMMDQLDLWDLVDQLDLRVDQE